jgi:hypothetical protein
VLGAGGSTRGDKGRIQVARMAPAARQLVGSAVGVPANVCGIDKIKPSTNRSENPQMQHSAR